jgi:hypothetical protein
MKSYAPLRIACTAIGMSPWPVMKITGARAALKQLVVQVGPGHPRHADVEQHAPAAPEIRLFEKRVGRGKGFHVQIGGAEQHAHRDEGLEEAPAYLRRHALAEIGHRERGSAVEFDAGHHPDAAGFGRELLRCFDRIANQVERRLLDEQAIGAHERPPRRQLAPEGHARFARSRFGWRRPRIGKSA